RSELLLEWLEQHPKERGHLFSVNNRALCEQGEQVTTSKHPKAYYHGLIARHIFSQDQDPGVRQLYADSSNDKAWGAKVRTWIAALRKEYTAVKKDLGLTGVGLTLEQRQENPAMNNLYGECTLIYLAQARFLLFERCHNLMNGQPNVDSIVSNSQMGFDHAGDASTMFFSKAR
ncbi:hypothetical protein BDW22DRAFT_1310059, partial [Trametopsis cervina]